MYFLLDILFGRAEQKQTRDLQLLYILSSLTYQFFFFFEAHVLAAEMKQILATVLTLICK